MTLPLPRVYSAAFVVVLLFASVSFAQFNPGQQRSTLSGEVQGGSEPVMHGYIVVLEDLGSHRIFGQADVQADGSFRFHAVPYGDYVLQLQTYLGDPVQQSFFTVDGRGAIPVIVLQKSAAARPPVGGVSAARLLHPPAKKAFQAFVQAQKFSASGRYADAARELERAVAISPGFAEAHSNLAVQHMRLGRFPEALAEINRAIEVGQPSSPDLANLAWVQAAMGRLPEAQDSARAALRMDPSNPAAHYILGTLLARDLATLRESAAHLSAAGTAIPHARQLLDRVRALLPPTAP